MLETYSMLETYITWTLFIPVAHIIWPSQKKWHYRALRISHTKGQSMYSLFVSEWMKTLFPNEHRMYIKCDQDHLDRVSHLSNWLRESMSGLTLPDLTSLHAWPTVSASPLATACMHASALTRHRPPISILLPCFSILRMLTNAHLCSI